MLEIGEPVVIRDYRNRATPWSRGVIQDRLVTYRVLVGKILWKRHVDQLRSLAGCKVPDLECVEPDSNLDLEVCPFSDPDPEVMPLPLSRQPNSETPHAQNNTPHAPNVPEPTDAAAEPTVTTSIPNTAPGTLRDRVTSCFTSAITSTSAKTLSCKVTHEALTLN